jgi:hypothetical protein
MAEIIECPQCHRKLRMDETVLGQTVQCPSCQESFTAALPNQPAPPPRPRPNDDRPMYRPVEIDAPRPRYDSPPPPPRYDAPPSRRRRYEDEDEDYPRSERRRFGDYQRPHRGSQVQTLGILSLVLLCMPVPAFILSIVTISMAVSDLSAMNRGEMDESGRGQTKVGLVCAIISPVILGLAVFAFCGLNILNDL